MKIKTYLVALSALAFGSAMRADEGMWLLQLMKQQNSIELMKKQGLKLEADDLYNPGGVSLKDVPKKGRFCKNGIWCTCWIRLAME